MKILALVATVLLTQSASADRVKILSNLMKGATPYQILKQTFDESNTPIVLQDLKSAGAQNCVEAEATDAAAKHTTVEIKQSIKVIVPGHPAEPENGPLLPAQPAVPDQVDTRTFPIAYYNGDSQETLNKMFDGIDVKTEDTRITTTLTSTPALSVVNSPLVVEFRKNNELVIFSIQGPAQDQNIPAVDMYGYCWKAPKKK